MMSEQRTAVIVVNYCSHSLLKRNLVDISNARSDLIVVVVDNYSTSLERDIVVVLCKQQGWTLVASADNVGYGQGNNIGVEAAKKLGAGRFLLLNPDARIDEHSLQLLEEAVDRQPLTAVAPVIQTSDGATWFDGMSVGLKSGRMRATRRLTDRESADSVPWLTGACMMMSDALWSAVGGFDADYFLYWEDVDLSWRCAGAGGAVAVVPTARAIHDEGGTHGIAIPAKSKSDLYYYFNIRNRLLFAGRHLSRWGRWRWVMLSVSEAYAILKRGGGRRHLLGSRGPWLAAIRGTLDGLGLLCLSGTSPAAPLRVLLSSKTPTMTSNPYIVMLGSGLDAIGDEVSLKSFSWRVALTERFDVFHAHWPENLVAGRTSARALAHQLLYLLVLCKLRVQHTAIVRTMHNLDLPQGISRRESLLIRLTDHWTDLIIRLNPTTSVVGKPYETIEHGHYRDWFAEYPEEPQKLGQIAYVGRVRRYKSVDSLIAAFSGVSRETGSFGLVVGGNPSTPALRQEIVQLASGDPRIELRLGFLMDAEFVAIVSASELVVLPYPKMHNSGAVLAVLSLDRPVLVPRNQFNELLAAEVGTYWVQLFEPPLTGNDLVDTLHRLREAAPDDRTAKPDLSGRDWPTAIRRHIAAYRRAVLLRRTPKFGPPRSAGGDT